MLFVLGATIQMLADLLLPLPFARYVPLRWRALVSQVWVACALHPVASRLTTNLRRPAKLGQFSVARLR
jgi:hypothetical protein